MHELRPFQKEALEALFAPAAAHVICVAPTGSGKSLIYERAAKSPKTRMLLVTPLIALARQQEERLRALGIPVTRSMGESKEKPPAAADAGAWICSPETLQNPGRRSWLARFRPSLLVVDECHCFWDWGEQFRPAFERLPELLRDFGIPRSLWLTATLPSAARQALVEALPSPVRQIGGFALPRSLHLKLLRVPWINRAQALIHWLGSRPEPGVIFVPTRELTQRLARLLESLGRRAHPYHAGLSLEERAAVEQAAQEKRTDVIIATSAFGMGVHHPHLKWVALWQAPPSPLALAQSVGRAGRAGDGQALVMWDREDFRLLEWMLGNSERRRSDLLATLRILEARGCHESPLQNYFNLETEYRPCGRCAGCLSD